MQYKVLSEYNLQDQAHSPIEKDFWRALIVDEGDESGEVPFDFSSIARNARMSSLRGGVCAPAQTRREISRTVSVDELAHPNERELRALMIAGLDGDGAAYHALLKRLTGHLRAYFRYRFARIGHGPTEAEDLLQEVLIAMHTHRHTYDRLQPFTPWLHAIARYKFLDFLRRTKSSFRDLPTSSAEELTVQSDTAAVESGLDLQRLMAKISSKARAVIQYVKLEGLSVSETAARCGMSESAVKVAVHRGLKALASQIRKESEA
jgi:RNA polymerase sigma-70 factor (ECF subfamily)